MFFQIVLALFALLAIKYGGPFVNWLKQLQNKRKHMKNVLGPESLPIIGCIHKFPIASEGILIYCEIKNYSHYLELLPFLIEEANKILEKGESVMRLWVGPKLIVLPLDAEATKVKYE